MSKDLDSLSFTLRAVLARVDCDGDLFAGVITISQRLDRALRSIG